LEVGRIDEFQTVDVECEPDDVGCCHGRHSPNDRLGPSGNDECEWGLLGCGSSFGRCRQWGGIRSGGSRDHGQKVEEEDGDDQLEKEEGEGKGACSEDPFVAVRQYQAGDGLLNSRHDHNDRDRHVEGDYRCHLPS
jgi:hypothetical protein